MEFFRTLLGYIEPALLLPAYLIVVFIVHELGHYLAARLMDLPVQSVVLGRGRLLKSWKDDHGTQWFLHLLPMRAHVQIAGFEDHGVSAWKRFVIIIAGPLANMLLPFVLFFSFFITFGKPVELAILTLVERGMPGYEAGLRPGDVILSVNGAGVSSSADLTAYTHARRQTPLDIVYERGGIPRRVQIMPEWQSYRDIDGIKREHGMIGVSMRQRGYDLEHVKSVEGVAVRGSDEARDALRPYLGRDVEIGLMFNDGKVAPALIHLSEKSAAHWDKPGHKAYTRFNAGTIGDNVYIPMPLSRSRDEAIVKMVEMIGHIARLPFNLFPIDKTWVTPDATVSKDTAPVRAYVYSFVFFTSLCSVLIGFLNLVPFPGLDGGLLVLLAAEVRAKRPLANSERAAALVFTLLLFYAAVFGANTNDMRHYYTFQIQKAMAGDESVTP